MTGLKRLSWAAALLVMTGGLAAEAQPVSGSLLGRGMSYSSFVPPSGCASTSVAVFLGSPVALGCDADLTFNGSTLTSQQVTIDGGALTLTPVAAPGAPTLTATVAGTKPAGDWNYKCTWVTATGETALGTVSSNITVDGSKAITITQPASPPALATGWKVYSSKQGPTATWWVTSTTIPIGRTTYDDNAADAALTVDGSSRDGLAGNRFYRGAALAGQLGSNTSYGVEAGDSITTGYAGTAIGYQSQTEVTSGYYNTSAGYQASFKLTTGYENTSLGGRAQNEATSASRNTSMGYAAHYYLTSGSYNVAIGHSAGVSSGATPSTTNALTTGVNTTFVGASAGYGSATQRTNATAIGYQAYVDADNTVVLGDAAVTDVLAGSASQAKVSATGVKLISGSKPTCDATTRGLLYYVAGGAGAADTCEVCRKDAADAYAWVSLF